MSTTAEEVLDNLGMESSSVEQSAATVQQYIELQEREVELPCSITVYGTTVHRFQMVREEIDMPMGYDETTWVITGFDTDECTITLKNPNDWSKQVVTYEEFEMGDFEPLYHCEANPDGTDVTKVPCFGY